MLESRAFTVFSYNRLLGQYLAHSLFSSEMDCYVSISRILCFLPKWTVTLVSRAFSLFSPVMGCYVGISRILSVFSWNGLLR